MNCERAQRALCEQMDGEHLPARLADAAEAHLASCSTCRAFASGSARARTLVRIRPAEPVPDLIDPIMSAVVRDHGRHVRGAKGLPVRWGRRSRVSIAAAIAIGMFAGSLAVGGPWQEENDGSVASAATIVRDVQQVAPTIDAYRAVFTIDERGLAPDVPERHLELRVAFLAPQRFRMDLRDLTTYPSAAWTPTDVTFVQTATTTFRRGPTGCPSDLAPGVCPPTRANTTDRSDPSTGQQTSAADLVLPLATLSSAEGLHVIGTTVVDGHDAVEMRMTFTRAQALLPFLNLGGTWRPFYARDRVDVWLDAASWAPLRISVFPSRDPDRRAWELRFGRPTERPSDRILDVRRTSAEGAPAQGLFRIPGNASDPSVPLSSLPARVGYLPLTPTAPGDLALSSAVAEPAVDPVGARSLLLYSRGLSYVRLGERPGWHGPGLFGPVDDTAQQVTIAAGVGYYEPASGGVGRRLAIHGAGTDVYLESNLPRDRLFALAASLPVVGEPLPRAWRTQEAAGLRVRRVPLSIAIERSPVPLALPTTLPAGYAIASAELESVGGRTVGVTIMFRQNETDAAGGPLTLHVEAANELPAAASSIQGRVLVAGVSGRWTPSSGRLEWVSDGVYRSLQGATTLRMLLTIAGSIPIASTTGTESP